jgi:hypothetical protein
MIDLAVITAILANDRVANLFRVRRKSTSVREA